MRVRYLGFVTALILIISIVLVACGDDDDGGTAGHSMGDGSMMSGTMMPSATMGQGMTGTPAAGVDPDLAFIDSMIPHHQSAIAMARIAGEHAEHQEIRDLAVAVTTAQQAEIDQMTGWRDAWFPGAAQTGGIPGMENMAGMQMTDADMQMLRDADPFDRQFIDMMIPHHESAIAMARQILTTTQRPEIRQLAEAIVSAQQREIDEMTQWRAAWYGQ